PLAGQEHEDVTRSVQAAFVHGFHYGVYEVALFIAALTAPITLRRPWASVLCGRIIKILRHRAITYLHRIKPPRYMDDRRRHPVLGKMLGKTICIDGRRRNYDFEIATTRQELAQEAQQEIDIQAALVRLVDNDRVIAAQKRVAL